jgi:hypothetical protein
VDLTPNSSQDCVNGHRPVGISRLGVSRLASSKDFRLIGCIEAILKDAIADWVDVPHNKSARLEIVGPLGSLSRFGRVSAVIFATDLDGEYRRPNKKPHFIRRKGTEKIRGVRRERLTARREHGHGKPGVVRVRLSSTDRMGVLVETLGNSESNPARPTARRHQRDDPSVDQFRVTLRSDRDHRAWQEPESQVTCETSINGIGYDRLRSATTHDLTAPRVRNEIRSRKDRSP